MTDFQRTALQMAILDLRGVLQAEQWIDVCALRDSIDETIAELEKAFPDVVLEP